MATAAFKSTTKRTPVGPSSPSEDSTASSSSHRQRRSRSLSQFSRPVNPPDNKGNFVNTIRGSKFPEISLDDLAIDFFDSANRGRSGSRSFETKASPASGTASQRRGRSVMRKSSGSADDRRSSIGGGGGGRAVSDANSRRRRSVSVVRYQISDSESDLDHSQNSRSHVNLKNTDTGNQLMQKPVASNQRPMLRKSLSQRDFRSYDGYSSHSSILTDDEGAGAHFNKNGTEKPRPVYALNKVALQDMDNGLHKATRRESRHMGIEQVVVKPRTSTSSTSDRLLSNNSDVIKAVSSIRRNYETELEQSEKRKQDLLAEVVFEEQRGRELSKIVNDLIPATKNDPIQKPSRSRKRSNDRSRMSMRLIEEAEKYIEDFISNVEDTDISSIDGERSDTSSSIGGLIKPEAFSSPPMLRVLPVITDGSEKRKQDLLAEVVFEEQRGRELSKIVNDLIPATKNDPIQKPSRSRKRSNDRSRMSMRLIEEAEKYIEDFISNVEDTDISSIDGERSDTSSSIGGLIKPEAFSSPPMLRVLPVITDGVALPWLQWETSNDATPSAGPNKAQLTLTPNTASSTQEITKAHDQGNNSVSSHGSWSPDLLQEYIGKDVYSKFEGSNQSFSAKSKGLRYDMDEYLKVKSTEDLLIQRWKQQQRINSGSLLLCNLRLF
ncbi:hypothetical protein TanjilG_24223 [Lupinus angustifolius]|uniref:Uncharacterized protein n=1 Tax=Lupinus angustifolius TaxID=3871 RepID=A0A1J7GHQ2_LUPAN|nr:hypothetical protein TanjilG_24223 [Lupinus angustifolius]